MPCRVCIGVVSMKRCDCNERIGVKINSWKQFEELKAFFEQQAEKGVFLEIPVKKPYYIGHSADGKEMKFYDKLAGGEKIKTNVRVSAEAKKQLSVVLLFKSSEFVVV